ESAASFGGEKGYPENVDGEAMVLKSLDAGLAKIMSKMGISVVDSYRGAHLFDSIGLSEEGLEKCFRGTPAPIGGVGFAELEVPLRNQWLASYKDDAASSDAPGGTATAV